VTGDTNSNVEVLAETGEARVLGGNMAFPSPGVRALEDEVLGWRMERLNRSWSAEGFDAIISE
jgi:hypothetical protein